MNTIQCRSPSEIIKLTKVNEFRWLLDFFDIETFVPPFLDKIKDFLNEFEVDTEDGHKASKYVKQLVNWPLICCSDFNWIGLFQRNLANREQATLVIDLDDVASVDPELAEAIGDNCRRYTQIFSQVVQEMLPELKDHEVN